MHSIEDIINGCKTGDRKCQDQMVRTFAPKIMSICMRYTKNRDLANDALQETFVNALKYIHTYNGSGSFEGWLKRIAVNSSLNFIKNLKSHTWSDESVIDTNAFAEIPDVYSTIGKEEIMNLLNKLPHAQFVVFNLSVIEGYNHSEISEILNITESTSRATLCKARNRLVEILNEEGIFQQSLKPTINQ